MAGKGGGKKMTKKKRGKSTGPQKSDALVVEDHVEELSEGNNSDDLCETPSKGMKGQKRKRPSTEVGVASRTRARNAVLNRNETV
ncbi:unnamed protein product [Eruca vesicaria subsp. sativa]|uniref:Uncharacterized protein n=1 Tax=Eruca vesicaria subsp. sativa TaxID=29727 RepID=A0ABC8JP16_ERUVS|nr:unnamed protein product [Eruca vesicaria subsp. sativa]